MQNLQAKDSESDEEEYGHRMPVSPSASMAATPERLRTTRVPKIAKARLPSSIAELSPAARSAALRKLYVIWTCHMTALMLIIDVKMSAYLKHFKGDTVKSAGFNARGMMAMILSNLAIAPTLAKFSNAHGRKSMLLLGSSWSFLVRLMELVSPTGNTFLLTTSVSALANATLQGVQTTIAELFAGDPKGGGSALALLHAGTLAGGVVGPALGSVLAIRSLRAPVALGALLTTAQLAVVLFGGLPETLPEEQRVAFGGLKMENPTACLKLFMQGPRLAAIAALQLLSHLTTPMTLGRSITLVNVEKGWSVALRGQFTSLESAAAIPGLAFASAVVRSSMASGALLASIFAKAVQHILLAGWAKMPWQSFALTPLVVPHGAGQAVLSSMMLKAGAAAGLGQAELQGCLQGLQSLGMLLGLFLWTRCFAASKTRGRPQHFHFGPAVVAAAELAVGAIAVTLSQ